MQADSLRAPTSEEEATPSDKDQSLRAHTSEEASSVSEELVLKTRSALGFQLWAHCHN